MSPVARRSRRQLVRRSIVIGSGLAGALLAAAPTGLPVADRLWSAAFVAAVTWFGATAAPVVVLVAAAAATLLASTNQSLALAVAAVVVGVIAAGQTRASTRLTALASALVALSLLDGSGPDSPRLAAVTTTAVALILVFSGARGLSSRKRRRTGLWTAGVAGVLLLCTALGAVAALSARADAERGVDALRAAQRAGAGGDLLAAVDDFRAAERAFRAASGPLSSFGWAGRLVPGVSQQLAAAETSMDTAGDLSESLRRAARGIDLDAIGVRGGSVDVPALAATEPTLAALSVDVLDAVVRLSSIDRSLLLGPVSRALDDALGEASDARATADRLHRTVQVLPPLLGQGARPARYLVLFTSPVEARNRFGFPGAYAVLQMADGRLSFEEGGSISKIDPAGRTFDQARLIVPARVTPYLPYGVSEDWRSVTMPSDGPSVADIATQMADQTSVGTVDGVLLADPTALATIVGLVGNVPLPDLGIELTKKNTVDYLVRRQYLEFPDLGQQQADRKDLLVEVAEEVGQRLAGLTLPRFSDLADAFGPLVEDGHLVINLPVATHPDAADLVGGLGIDGAFPRSQDAGADVLYVGQRNRVGNKIDLFLERSVSYDVQVSKDGAIAADLTVDLTNTAPASGLPSYVIGSALVPPPAPGTNLSTTLLYSRHRLTSLTIDGVPAGSKVLNDGGLLVYQLELAFGPGQKHQIKAHFEGALDTVAGGDELVPYALVAYPGGLQHPDDVTVTVADDRVTGTLQDTFSLVRPTCRSLSSQPEACRGR